MRPETLIAIALWLLIALMLNPTEFDRAWLVDRIDDAYRFLTDFLRRLL